VWTYMNSYSHNPFFSLPIITSSYFLNQGLHTSSKPHISNLIIYFIFLFYLYHPRRVSVIQILDIPNNVQILRFCF
jgi:hypothetical protein